MMKKLIFSLFVILPLNLLAQNYVIKSLGIKEGLSNNHVLSIEQDKRGFMWFATEEGLNMFDGINFRSFYKEKGKNISLSGNELNGLLDDPVDSILWIATQRAGINAYDYGKNKFYTYRKNPKDPNSLITDDITKIMPSSDGNLWICTYWKGIDYYNKESKKFTHYNTTTLPGLPSNNIWTAFDGKDGNLYIGHVRHGFSILNLKTKQIKNFRHIEGDASSIPDDEVTCIYKDRLGNIWVGTSNGVALYNPQKENFMVINDGNRNLSHRIYSIRQTEDNKLWIAMELGGIAILDLSQHLFNSQIQAGFTFIKEGDDDYGLSGNSIRSIYQDSYGNMWIGGWGSGINFISQEAPLFNTYEYTPNLYFNSLTNKTASSVCFDKSGQLWIGTDGGGINLFQNGIRKNVFKTNDYGSNNNNIQTSLCDSKGGLWFGLFYGGIRYFNTKTQKFEKISLNNNESNDADIRSFFEDKSGLIWVGTSQGIYVVNRDSKKMVKHYSLENNLVRSLYKDSKGRVWVGFFGDGMAVYSSDMKLIVSHNVDNNFPSNTVNTIFADSRSNIWVGTGEGLVKFENGSLKKYHVYNRESGLTNAHIFAITEDREKNIWISSNHGISCLIGGKNIIYNYGHRDDVPLGSFCRGSVAKDKENNIYFGSINGVCFFNPENVLKKRTSPKVLINTIEVAGVIESNENAQNEINIIGEKEVNLSYKQNSFTITFNIPNFALTSQVDYAYQLEGLSDNWYTINGSNSVTFRGLPPGDYKFSIKSRIHNQQWSDEISTLNIYIAPPIWLTIWAKIIYVILIGVFIFYLTTQYKDRLEVESLYKVEKKMREQEQELNNERLRFYTNITHELRTPLTLIIGPLEDLTHNKSLNSGDSQKINVIHKSAVKLLDLINQLLEFRKVETQNRHLCVEKRNIVPQIKDTCQKYISLNVKNEINIKCHIPNENITFYFDKEIIQTILDNLISNALKYTEKGLVTIGVELKENDSNNIVEIVVSDTGYGISEEALPHIFENYYQEKRNSMVSGTGIGLSLVKRLVETHEGEISVESTPNVGSTFSIKLLADNSYPNALHSEVEEGEEETIEEIMPEQNKSDKNILLIVEDNRQIAEYIAESFKDSYEIHIAQNGQQGRDEALKIIPDIIVSDIMMPIMDGNTMCKILKNDIRTSHIPIILLTAKDSLKDKEEGYQTGADSYLTKPFSSSLLRSRIENLLNSRNMLASYYKNNDINREEEVKEGEPEVTLSVLDNEFLQKLNGLISENLASNKMDIAYLSDKMFMSSSTLYRKMKALTGLSTNEYIRKMKMKHAKELLLEGRYNISEISVHVGFNNIFYFRQCFKEEFGATPSDYLKNAKKATSRDVD